jgi:hypothetical protein
MQRLSRAMSEIEMLSDGDVSQEEGPFDYEEDSYDDPEGDDEDDDDVVEVALDGMRLGFGMEGSDSDQEYGREGYYFPFDHDLILDQHHRDRYGAGGSSYTLTVPGYGNAWTQLFASVRAGKGHALLKDAAMLGDSESLRPVQRDFRLMPSQEALQEIKDSICHHLCDYR